jgi:hypothetical protein
MQDVCVCSDQAVLVDEVVEHELANVPDRLEVECLDDQSME